MTTVTFYRDETKCSCCGAYIRNVIAIDGVEYGTTCGEYQLKQLSSSITVSGKTASFSATAENIIYAQNKARRDALYNKLLAPNWHINTPTNDLIWSLFNRISTGELTAAGMFDARLQLRDIDTEAIVAREWKLAMME